MELVSLDLRYEGFRLKVPALEERLLASMAQRGIQEPLEGVELGGAASRRPSTCCSTASSAIAVRGSCGLATVPYVSLGRDEAAAILGLLRTSNNRTLSILEQAAFITELSNAPA